MLTCRQIANKPAALLSSTGTVNLIAFLPRVNPAGSREGRAHEPEERHRPLPDHVASLVVISVQPSRLLRERLRLGGVQPRLRRDSRRRRGSPSHTSRAVGPYRTANAATCAPLLANKRVKVSNLNEDVTLRRRRVPRISATAGPHFGYRAPAEGGEEMATSKGDARRASKQLKDKGSSAAQKSVAGSDLSQAKGKGKGKGK